MILRIIPSETSSATMSVCLDSLSKRIVSPKSKNCSTSGGFTKWSDSAESPRSSCRSSMSRRPRTFAPTSTSSPRILAPQKSSFFDSSTIGRSPVVNSKERNESQLQASLTRRHQRMMRTRTLSQSSLVCERYGLLFIFAVIGLFWAMISRWTSGMWGNRHAW